MSAAARRTWRAWDVFRLSLAASFLAFLLFIVVTVVLHLAHGDLTDRESGTLLRLLYWGTYPLVFVALGSLFWHLVQFYRGAYATR